MHILLPAPRRPHKTATTTPRRVARLATIALWLIGSAYIITHELARPQPDLVALWSAPVVWAVIIALPVLATYARRDREWIAWALIWLAAIAGSAYTLQATIGSRATSRDVAIASADDTARQRARLQADLATTKANLADAIARCGTGRTCADSTRELIGIYERQQASHEARLERLKPSAPAAGEHRVAWLIALATGRDPATVLATVGQLLPALLGIVLELAALACAKYGWSPQAARLAMQPVIQPASQSDYPAITPAEAAAAARFFRPDDSGHSGGQSGGAGPSGPRRGPSHSPGSEPRKSEVISALIADLSAGRTYGSQRELSERFGVPRSTLSDWLREAESAGTMPPRRTVGRCKMLAG